MKLINLTGQSKRPRNENIARDEAAHSFRQTFSDRVLRDKDALLNVMRVLFQELPREQQDRSP